MAIEPPERLVPARHEERGAQPRRALVVTQYGLAVEGLRELLRRHGFTEIDAVTSVAAGAALARSRAPALVVVGTECLLPHTASALQSLRGSASGVRVVALAHQAQSAWLGTLVQHGADGVMFHESAHEEIARGLEDIVSGIAHFDRRAQTALLQNLSDAPPRSLDLTGREMQVLQFVARGFSNKAIARELKLTEGTVKTYLRRLRQRLGARDRTHAAIYALSLGIIEPERG